MSKAEIHENIRENIYVHTVINNIDEYTKYFISSRALALTKGIICFDELGLNSKDTKIYKFLTQEKELMDTVKGKDQFLKMIGDHYNFKVPSYEETLSLKTTWIHANNVYIEDIISNPISSISDCDKKYKEFLDVLKIREKYELNQLYFEETSISSNHCLAVDVKREMEKEKEEEKEWITQEFEETIIVPKQY